MRLQKLLLRGFKSYKKETEIDFTKIPQNHVFLIHGRTGAGKSSIFDAITFAFYGQPSDYIYISEFILNSLKESYENQNMKKILELYNQNPICSVELSFLFENHHYKIVHKFEIKNLRKLPEKFSDIFQLRKEFYKEGTEIDTSFIKQILKISRDQFRQIILLPQNEFDKFLKSNSIEKEEILKSIFKTEKYDEFIKKLNDKRSQLNKELEILYQKLEADLKRFNIQKFNKENIIEEFNYQILQIEKERESLESKLQDIQHLKSKNLSIKNDLENVIKNIENFINTNEELKNLMKHRESIEAKQNRLEKAKKVIDLYEIQKQILEMNRQSQKIQEELKEKKDRFKNFHNEIKKLEIREKEILEKKTKLDALKKEQLQVENQMKHIQKLDVYKNLEISINTYNQNIKNLESMNEKIEKDISRIKNSLIEIYKFILSKELKENMPCPVCGSREHPDPYHKHNKNRISHQMLKELEELEARYEKIKIDIQKNLEEKARMEGEYKNIKSDLENNFPDFLTDQNIKNNLSNKLREIQKYIQSLDMEIKQYEKKVLDTQKTIIQIESDINNLEEYLKSIQINFQRKESELIQKMQKKAIQNKKEISEYYLEAKKMLDLENEINEFKTKETSLKTEIQTYVKELNQKNIEIQEINVLFFNKKKEELINIQKKIKENEEEMGNLQKKIGGLREKHENLLSSFNEIIKNYENYKKQEDEYIKIDKLYRILSDQNRKNISFHRFILQNYFNNVVHFANERLKEIQPRYEIFVSSEKENTRDKKSGLNLKIFDKYTGDFREKIQSLSGGETFYISLCLALGLYDTIHTKISGLQFDFLFIDEGFGSLDEDTIETVLKILRSLNNLKNKFKQIGIISHVEFLKKGIPYKIYVHNQDGLSSIEYQL